jgi:UDP-2,3-diacylglucosamine pyrophosphatase LpxH
MQVIKEIMNLLSESTRVIYVTGNHDEMMRRYSDIHLGNFQLTDKLVMEINGKMTWIFHGEIKECELFQSAKMGEAAGPLLFLTARWSTRFVRVAF